MAKRGAATTRGRATASTHSIPAPIGGLNAYSAVAAMPETDALVMDNWFPDTTAVSLRRGRDDWVTGISGWVESVVSYVGATGTRKLFGFAGTKVYDCTTQGAVGAAVVTGLTNARWESVNVGTPGGQYLYAANAIDPPLLYDGSTWVSITGVSVPAITGVTTTLLRNPVVWKNRVWFVENNSNRAWYLPVQSIGGAATSLDVGTQFRRGGYLQAILTFSVSSASDFDDYIGFLSSEGELAVYTGTDPSTPGLFNITGTYRMGKPIGRRCWFKYGPDAIIICSDGFVSVSRVIAVGIQNPQDAVSYKILALVNAAVQSYSGNFGWQGIVHSAGNKLIINVPQNENSRQFQFVMNTLNDSWCTFGNITTPWNAATFCALGDDLYFGGNGYVAKCDIGASDAGSNIIGNLKTAFSYIGSDRQKRFTMVRPLLQTTGTIIPAMALNVDFQNTLPTGTPTFSNVGSSMWNIALWNVSYWFSGYFLQKNWQTVTGIGFSAALYLTVASGSPTVSLMAIDYVYEPGGDFIATIVPNDTIRAMAWAVKRWPQTSHNHNWGPHVTLHLEKGGLITAVVVYNEYQPANSIDIHVAAVDGGRWLTRPFLSAVFRYPFEQLGVRRVTARIGADNMKASRFLESLGFTLEGVIRQGWEPDVDMLVFGLLKAECRFLGVKYSEQRLSSGPAGSNPNGCGPDAEQSHNCG